MKKVISNFIFLSGLLMSFSCLAGIYMGTGMQATTPEAFDSVDYPGVEAYAAPAPSAYNPSIQCYQTVTSGKGPLAPSSCPPMQKNSGRPRNYKVHTGSLKDNVQQMVAQSHWGTVIWNVPNDYRWIGNITITATSIQDALSQYLAPYPVQAIFYQKNHIVSIVPRRPA